jgi:hypothetical protein
MRVNSSSAGTSALSGKPLIGGDELSYRRGLNVRREIFSVCDSQAAGDFRGKSECSPDGEVWACC